jgi:hypothetical protein
MQQLWKAPPIEMFKVNWDDVDVVDNPTYRMRINTIVRDYERL